MNNSVQWSNIPHPKGSLIWFVLTLALMVCAPLAIGNLKAIEDDHIMRVLVEEGQLADPLFRGANHYRKEVFWRNELKSHWGDLSRDRLYGIGCMRLADILCRRAAYYEEPISAEAATLYKRALKVEENLGGSITELNGAAESLADYYQRKGMYDDSEKILKRKMVSLARRYNSHRVMEIVSQLVCQYIEQKRYADGVEVMTQEFRERELIGFPKYAEPWNLYELARLYYLMGEDAQTVSICNEAIRVFGNGVNNTPIRSYLASSLRRMGRLVEAEAEYRLDLKCERERRMWDGISWTLIHDSRNGSSSDLLALGEICMAQGRYSEAESLLKEALKIGLMQLGMDDAVRVRKQRLEFVKGICVNIAKVYRKLRCPMKAEEASKFAAVVRLLPLDPYCEYRMPF